MLGNGGGFKRSSQESASPDIKARFSGLVAETGRRYNPFMAVAQQLISELSVTSEDETATAAGALSKILQTGDVVTLSGSLGAGKTAFARALINALPGDDEDVPSPTFTLVQTYQRGPLEVWHFDLYRLEDPDEALELGIEDAFADAVSLIEWPDRLGSYLPDNHLRIDIQNDTGHNSRRISAHGPENWSKRLADLKWGTA